jgi:thioredoxin 1
MIFLTDQNFEEEINKYDKPVLVDFFAEWCPPCKMLSPILEKLEGEFGEKIVFAKINVDAAPKAAQKFGINPIPTVILLKKGEPVGSFVGLMSESDIKNWLENLLK